ncbi:MAG: hypothetical protein WCV90_00045 [Candidatus Woesearchaeota archaeon]|jgi:hypothetical protein
MRKLYSSLVGLLATGYLAFSVIGCGTQETQFSGRNECNTDRDCPGETLCINNKCDEACYTDNDCPGEQYCQNSQCVNPEITPQTVFDQMVSAMETGNLDAMINCCLDPDYEKMYHQKLAGKDLVQMAAQLKGKKLVAPSPGSLEYGTQIIQYQLDLGEKEYSPLFVKKQDGTWRIRAM